MEKLRASFLVLALIVTFTASALIAIPVSAHSTGTLDGPKKVHVSYHYKYNVQVWWCFQFPGVQRSQYGGYEITDGGNITANATDDAYFWGYNLVSPGGYQGRGIVEDRWDANGNPLPYHIDGQYHNITCGAG